MRIVFVPLPGVRVYFVKLSAPAVPVEEFVRLVARRGELLRHSGVALSQAYQDALDRYGFAGQQQYADYQEQNSLQKGQRQSGHAQQYKEPTGAKR